MELITNIAALRKYVKLNASTNWDTYRPYLLDAQEKYIVPFFGSDFLEELQGKENEALLELLRRALGPFSLALATHEMSINFGETGHTVSRTDTLAPASDAKIEKATESLFDRGWSNLDKAIKYALLHKADYQSWHESEYMVKFSTTLFLDSIDFQDNGMVDIRYSPLTFSRLRTLIIRVEKSETLMMIPDGYSFRENNKLFSAMQAFTASRVAEIHTNAIDKRDVKDNPPIEFLREEYVDSKNYYANQASFWKSKIYEFLVEAQAVEDNQSMQWNNATKKIIVAGARTIK